MKKPRQNSKSRLMLMYSWVQLICGWVFPSKLSVYQYELRFHQAIFPYLLNHLTILQCSVPYDIFNYNLIFEQKQMVKGQILYKNGDYYHGQLSAGQLSGKGIYKFKDGSVYEGEFAHNVFNGRGKLIDKFNQITIIGEFKNGKADGYVRITYSDGSQFEGIVKEGLRNGKGTYTNTKDKIKYEGQFKDDQFDGAGELFHGEIKYKGNFENGLYQREGQLKTKQYTYIGEFKKGNIEGKGFIKYSNGQQYEGQFLLNKKVGFGTFVYEDGSKYTGQWKDDVRNGKGKIIYQNGNIFSGQFVNGNQYGEGICKYDKWDMNIQIQNQKLNGPMKMMGEDEKIEVNYQNGKKNGTLIYEKMNKYGQKVVYRGTFKEGKENPYSVSYSQRF